MEISSVFFCSLRILGEAGFTNNCTLYSSSTAAPCRAPGVVQPRLQGELCSGAISTAIAWHHSSVTATAAHGCIPCVLQLPGWRKLWGIAPVPSLIQSLLCAAAPGDDHLLAVKLNNPGEMLYTVNLHQFCEINQSYPNDCKWRLIGQSGDLKINSHFILLRFISAESKQIGNQWFLSFQRLESVKPHDSDLTQFQLPRHLICTQHFLTTKLSQPKQQFY